MAILHTYGSKRKASQRLQRRGGREKIAATNRRPLLCAMTLGKRNRSCLHCLPAHKRVFGRKSPNTNGSGCPRWPVLEGKFSYTQKGLIAKVWRELKLGESLKHNTKSSGGTQFRGPWRAACTSLLRARLRHGLHGLLNWLPGVPIKKHARMRVGLLCWARTTHGWRARSAAFIPAATVTVAPVPRS